MESKFPTLDFDLGLLHNHVLHGPILHYCISTIFIILLLSHDATWVNQQQRLAVLFHRLDEIDKYSPKKR